MAIIEDPSVPVRREAPGQERKPEAARLALHFKVPTEFERIRWQREVALLGGKRHGVLDVLALLRRGLRELVTDEDSLENLLAAVDHVEASQRAVWEAAGDGVEVFVEAIEALQRADAEVAEMADLVRQAYPPYARALADNEVYPTLAGYAAAKLFVVGWENVPGAEGPPTRTLSGLTDEAMTRIPRELYPWVGAVVHGLSTVTEDDAGNSVSPPHSPSTRKSWSAAKGRPRKTRSRSATGGGSSKSASPS